MKTVAFLGGSKIGQGPWRPGKKMCAVAVLGGVDIDFRQAQLEADVTKLTAVSILGGVKVVLPPGMPVSLSGFSFLGGKEIKRPPAKEPPPPTAKALHISGVEILGGLTITGQPAE